MGVDVIFLDIDGVITRPVNDLINNGDYIGSREDTICPKCLGILEDIVNKTKAKIVVSSTWRLNYDVEDLRRVFREKSLTNWDAPIIDTVRKRSYGEEIRGDLVQEWIDDHDVDDYAILDDDSDFYYYQPLVYVKENDDKGGLENIDINEIINLFVK